MSKDTPIVLFGTHGLRLLYARRKAINPQRIMLAVNGGDKLRGENSVTVVRFPEEWWKPATFSCEKNVREVEEQIKRIKQTGGEVIEHLEQ
jgi:hypothetical protein